MVLHDSLGELHVYGDGPGWTRFWPEYEGSRWEPDLLARLQSRSLSGRVCVDVGAWIGPVSMWMARLGASVLAVEPDPVAYTALVRNVAANRLNIATICAAVTVETGLARISPNPGGEFGNSSTRVTDDGLLVAAFTLPDLLELVGIPPEQVALVKVDIEGYEADLMPELEPWLWEHDIPLELSVHVDGATVSE